MYVYVVCTPTERDAKTTDLILNVGLSSAPIAGPIPGLHYWNHMNSPSVDSHTPIINDMQ